MFRDISLQHGSSCFARLYFVLDYIHRLAAVPLHLFPCCSVAQHFLARTLHDSKMATLVLDTLAIQVSCQQTRFHIAEDAATKEIDVHDLNVSIVERPPDSAVDRAATKRKSAKARPDGLEILSGAHLRVKAGGRYGFVGRNGSGKSSMIRPFVPASSMSLTESSRPSHDCRQAHPSIAYCAEGRGYAPIQ